MIKNLENYVQIYDEARKTTTASKIMGQVNDEIDDEKDNFRNDLDYKNYQIQDLALKIMIAEDLEYYLDNLDSEKEQFYENIIRKTEEFAKEHKTKANIINYLAYCYNNDQIEILNNKSEALFNEIKGE